MADVSQNGLSSSSRTEGRAVGRGSLFGVPLGDLSLFTSVLMSFATGFAAFFAATFCAIVGLLVWNTASHRPVDFAYTYSRVGLPVGLVVLVVALAYLGTLWTRRHFRKA